MIIPRQPGTPSAPSEAATEPPPPPYPFSFNQIYHAELQRLRPGALDGIACAGMGPDRKASAQERSENLKATFGTVHQAINADGSGREPLAALCFSGGGIRSATFNLGVLQALAGMNLLSRFDYLSSVSGGGYISGWLQAWRRQAARAGDWHQPLRQLGGLEPVDRPLSPEPKPVDHLREYSNYLTPRLGVFSADLWTVAAIVIRNLVLNWAVVLPVLVAGIALPQLALLVTQLAHPDLLPALAVASVAVGTLGHVATFCFRAHRLKTSVDLPPGAKVNANLAGLPFQFGWMLALPWISALGTGTLALWWADSGSRQLAEVDRYGLAWLVLSPLLGWITSQLIHRKRTLTGQAFEALGIALGGAVSLEFFHLAAAWLPWLVAHPIAFVPLAVPVLLALQLVSHTVLVAVLAAGEMLKVAEGPNHEMDREWWARLSGWVLMLAVAWLLVSGVVLASEPLVGKVSEWIAGAGGISGLAVWLLARSGKTRSGRRDDTGNDNRFMEMGLKLAVPLFCGCVMVLLALLSLKLGRVATGNPALLFTPPDLTGRLGIATLLEVRNFSLMMLAMLATGGLIGMAVNVNRFSLQGMYRNRLVRAYLGASNLDRRPDLFTGFDPRDDFPLQELWRDDEPAEQQRPMPVVNAALNLVKGGDNLAWQQRKAESFSMTPLFCGNFHDGYRRSDLYGGGRGIRLGTAVAISGAAANPNMGYHSSSAVTFLMTLFNARLGSWLGNTGHAGETTYRFPGPRNALRPMLAELFGQTDDTSPYVNLSDGGHFENLGVYEMVLRRCRYLLVSDAGQDPDAGFSDLGNAIRKIRIDFGIPIEFTARILISPRKETESSLYCALARVYYSKVDANATDGFLIYLKPTLTGAGEVPLPYDVRAYANTSPLFPHETTADQWFDESQFESYRALGLHSLRQVVGAAQTSSIAELFQAVKDYVEQKPSAAAKKTAQLGVTQFVGAEAGQAS
jgi:hypothetical protein